VVGAVAIVSGAVGMWMGSTPIRPIEVSSAADGQAALARGSARQSSDDYMNPSMDEVTKDKAAGQESTVSDIESATANALAAANEAAAAVEDGGNVTHSVKSYRFPIDDPEIERERRNIVELMETSCRQSGYNCEYARVMRRQHDERYGR
jgi:hypothetical protein